MDDLIRDEEEFISKSGKMTPEQKEKMKEIQEFVKKEMDTEKLKPSTYPSMAHLSEDEKGKVINLAAAKAAESLLQAALALNIGGGKIVLKAGDRISGIYVNMSVEVGRE